MNPSSYNALNNSNIDTMNTSVLSGNGPTPKNNNYRKAFKPNIGGNSVSQGGDDQEYSRSNYKNDNPSYEPARRSPHIAKR
jgi:hypothetical protein